MIEDFLVQSGLISRASVTADAAHRYSLIDNLKFSVALCKMVDELDIQFDEFLLK